MVVVKGRSGGRALNYSLSVCNLGRRVRFPDSLTTLGLGFSTFDGVQFR